LRSTLPTVESLFKRTVREGEKELMLAVLEDAISSFERYLVSGMKGKETIPRSKKHKNGYWEKIRIGFFLLTLSARPCI
jgi:hypothetical protein